LTYILKVRVPEFAKMTVIVNRILRLIEGSILNSILKDMAMKYSHIQARYHSLLLIFCLIFVTSGFANEFASTYLGGFNTDDTYEPAIQIDSQGYVYVTGFTYSTNFPTTTGVLDTEFTGFPSMERFVTKFTPDLSEIVASTFIGGSGHEWGMGICFDDDDNLYLGGYTSSLGDFPLTDSSYVSDNLGGLDVYIIKLTNDLTTLLGSTVFGGSLDDGFQWPRMNLAVGQNGDIYATGVTKSFNFPYTTGTFDSTYGGGFNNNGGDAFVVKFNSNLTDMLASTYLGGTADEWRVDLVLDSNDNPIISGATFSTEFPTTAGSYDPTYDTDPQNANNFITKFSSDLTTILASTFIETIGAENPLAIVLDNNDNICISGYTTSNHPTTIGAYDRTFNGVRDAYISILDNDLENLLYSTFVGGNGFDMGYDLDIDSDGNFYLTGATASTNLPSHPEGDAYDPSFNGVEDAYIVKLDSELSTILASTYVGGTHLEKGKQIAIGLEGNIYVVGNTSSTDFPTTPNTPSPSYNGGENDCFVFRIAPDLKNIANDIDEEELTPSSFTLLGNYPNPFNSQTKIQFSLNQPSDVRVKIFDIAGRLVNTIEQFRGIPGINCVVWNGNDYSGKNVSSGTYFYEIHSGSSVNTGKMLLLK
jgi:FlgD Ig-like domain/Beta-propeller repeat